MSLKKPISSFPEFCELFREARLLEPEEEQDLIRRIHDKDEAALDLFVFSNMKLVISRALRFCGPKDPRLIDLISDGSIGLVWAIEKFDLSKGFQFSTYAVWWIDSFIRKGLKFFKKETSNPITDLKTHYQRAFEILRAATRQTPTEEEVARFLNWPRYVLRTYQKCTDDRIMVDHNIENTLPDKSRSPVDTVLLNENKDRVEAVLHKLSPVHEDIIRRRYGIGYSEETLTDIASFYGLAKERIRQKEADALRELFVLLSENKEEPKAEPEPRDEEAKKRIRERKRITQLIPKLDSVKADLVRRHYGIGCKRESLEGIAKAYGVDPDRARQILGQAVDNLFDLMDGK
jgi:RNA polymerase primary sigma factor